MKRVLSVLALASLALIVLVIAVGMVHAQDKSRFARASESVGDVWVLRLGEDEWEPCGLNTPLGESDILETEGDSYAEIEFDNGAILSLNEDTRVDFKHLTFNSRGGRTTLLSVPYGAVRIRVPAYVGVDDYLTIDLPTGSVDVDGNTSARINVRGSKASEILVYSGQARLEGRDGEAFVRSGDRAYLDSEGFLGVVLPIPKIRDEFDLWCSKSYEKYDSRDSRPYLGGDGYYTGLYDLDYHGNWVYVAEYGRCWRPRAAPGWYPYYDGHWVWSVHWGWTWVSYEPWGWIPYHYGRWVHTWRWGWVWVPGRVWGPAWVTWVYYDDCIGWGPLCPWDYPCYCYDYRCHGPWTYVYRYSFYHPHRWHRYRRGGRYKYFNWGEKRYKYRDGKEHDKADFRKEAPQSPGVAMKNFKPTEAEKKIMKAEEKVVAGAGKTIPRENEAREAAVSRDLPEKPRAAKVETERAAERRDVEDSNPAQKERNDKLPAKPRNVETDRDRSSEERTSREKESAPAAKPRSQETERPSYEYYEPAPAREERKESDSEQRSESRGDQSRTQEKREVRSVNGRDDNGSSNRYEKEEKETERQEERERSRADERKSTSPHPSVMRKSVR